MAYKARTADGRWRVRWRRLVPDAEGRVWDGCTVDTSKDADTIVAQVHHSQRVLRRDWEPPTAPRRPPSLIDLAEAYIREGASTKWKPRTTTKYIVQLGRWSSWAIAQGHTTAASLTRAMLIDWHTAMAGRSPGYRQGCVSLVEQLWAWAYDRADDVAEWEGLIPRPRAVSSSFRVPQAPYRPAPTWAEMAACVQAAGATQPHLVLAYYTGLRWAQLSALRWSDVDLGPARLTVRPELGKTAQESTGRVVPISAHLVRWLRQRRKELQPKPGDLIVPPMSGTLSVNLTTKAWRASGAREAAWTGRPHHAFRAGFQSGLRGVGAQIDAVEYLVGHSLPQVSAHAYIDPDALGLRPAVDLIPNIWSTDGVV